MWGRAGGGGATPENINMSLGGEGGVRTVISHHHNILLIIRHHHNHYQHHQHHHSSSSLLNKSHVDQLSFTLPSLKCNLQFPIIGNNQGGAFFPKQFTVGVLNATLDLAALVLVGVAAFLGSEVVLSPVVSRCLPSCGGWGVVGVAASRTKTFRNQNHRFQSKFAYCKLFGVYAGVIFFGSPALHDEFMIGGLLCRSLMLEVGLIGYSFETLTVQHAFGCVLVKHEPSL